MGVLDPREARRLASTLELMSSPMDGEKLAAVAAAQRILDKHGLRFRDLAPEPVAPALAPSPWSGAEVNPWRPNRRPNEINLGRQHQLLARALLQTGHHWSEWEHRFLTSMTTRPAPSEKEKAKLAELRAVVWEVGR